MIKLNPNREDGTKFQIPAFSVTMSQILVTILIVGLTVLSFFLYINASYLIDIANIAMNSTLNIIESILMLLGIGLVLIILWSILIILSIKLLKIRNILKSYKKEAASLVVITFLIWGISGILFTSNGFPGWTPISQSTPLGGVVGQIIAGYSYGTTHVILRLSGILIISSIIAKPTLIPLLSRYTKIGLQLLHKTSMRVFKSINGIYSLKSPQKAIQASSLVKNDTEYITIDTSENHQLVDILDDKNSSQIQDLTDETPGDFIESEYSQNNDLYTNELEKDIVVSPDFITPRPEIIENNGALFNEFWGKSNTENDQKEIILKEISPKTIIETVDWKTPTLEILENSDEITITVEEIEKTSDTIKKTFAEYRIEVEVAQVKPGPTVTMYGIEPGWIRKSKRVQAKNQDGSNKLDSSGKPIVEQKEDKTRVSVDNILRREKDLSLALKTPSLRIETPVMGESLLGIEVPNPNPSLVSLRKVMQSNTFEKLTDKSVLPVALGRGSDGDEVVFDLAKMPHLLIAGATGSGKSVCMNAIISCLIMKHSPADLQMLLVDPKRVELTPYNGIPHLITPVVVETDKVVNLLKGLIQEMMDRYRIMDEIGVRNIATYNKKASDKMPYIVVAIDELADLMMTAAFDVEQSICRLAQLGRATGIHLIIATQRPSVDVITGLIKANFPSRISFAVTSQVDSRTILDTVGADKLLGKGDMLYQPIDMGRPTRVQSVYISDHEISKIVQYWQNVSWGSKTSIDLNYAPGSSDQIAGTANIKDDKDSLLEKAIELAQRQNKVSTSLLQRRLRIGYPRAARLMDDLEDMGIVGPSDGSKSRDVIIQTN